MKHLSKTILALCFISLLAEQSKASVRQNSLLRVENRTEQSSTFDQSPSISQFTDVQPTDWAYSALKNLLENYGCVAGLPNGAFKGGQAIGRYEKV